MLLLFGAAPAPPPAGAAVAASTLAETASATTLDGNVPAGTTTGDVLVAVMTQGVTGPVPDQAGWTLIDKATQGTTPTGMWYRLATGSEPASYTFTASALGRISLSLHRLTGVDTTTPLDAASVTATAATGTTSVTPSITTATDGALALYDISVQTTANTVTPASGTTTVTDTGGVDGRRQLVARETIATAGATGTRTWTISASLPSAAIAVAFRPSGGGGPATPTRAHLILDIPTGSSVAAGVRTTLATSVRLQVSTSATFASGIVSGSPVVPNAQGDSQLSVSGLTANTFYYVRTGMTVSGVETFSAITGPFRTAPTGPTSFAFDFGSCVDAVDSAAMAAIAARGDDLFFHVGDPFYADGTGTTVANIRDKLAAKLAAPNHAAVYSSTPSAYTPSDHDATVNNSNAGNQATAWANWNTARSELYPAPTTYYSFTWGRVRFIQIDRRSFASSPAATDNASKTSLGATQEQWLMDTVTAATEPVVLIAQESPWIGTAVAGDDGWAGFTTERTRLANFFAASGKKIGMLAGDMHAVAADDGTNAPGGIFLFHAGPLNNNASQKGGPYTAGPYPASGTAVVEQYGRVVVTDTGSEITLAFTGYSADNTARVTQNVVIPTGAVTASPGAIGDTSSVAAPSVTTAATVSPGVATSTAALYAPTVSSAVTASPGVIGDGSAPYAPAATAATSVAPGVIASPAALYAPAVTAATTASPGAIGGTFSVFAPTAASAVTASPGVIGDGSSVATPTATPGAVTATAGAVADGSTTYPPAVTPGAVTVAPGFVTDASAAYGPAVTAATTVTPGNIPDGSTARPPTASSTVTATPGAVPDGSTARPPTVTAATTAVPAAIGDGSTVHAPTAVGAGQVSPAPIGDTSTPYPPTATTGAAPPVTVTPGSVADTSALLAPAVLGTVTVTPDGLATIAAVYGPIVVPTVTILAGAVADGTALHPPTAVGDGAGAGVTVGPGAVADTSTLLAPAVLGAVTITAPRAAGRTLTVPADMRTALVGADARTSAVAADPRTSQVPDVPRTFTVPASPRTHTV